MPCRGMNFRYRGQRWDNLQIGMYEKNGGAWKKLPRILGFIQDAKSDNLWYIRKIRDKTKMELTDSSESTGNLSNLVK